MFLLILSPSFHFPTRVVLISRAATLLPIASHTCSTGFRSDENASLYIRSITLIQKSISKKTSSVTWRVSFIKKKRIADGSSIGESKMFKNLTPVHSPFQIAFPDDIQVSSSTYVCSYPNHQPTASIL
ncbi:hypothetical protein AVEN_179444-1 [Araneus ventricosus]|uniref:Uncharacterized protein n=1 Tax=Araneus ventricosus TaxID=182803 RepID=A0A4Y2BE00_ARAVE|nr:hypothetical protein AVEN_179444-1 [Araneus ventricosus]